jgi:hypothetical protein
MCRTHWYRLPAALRERIWATYRRGQTLATASPEYLDALDDALDYARRAAAEDDQRGDEPGFPLIPPGQIDAEVAADVRRLAEKDSS